MVSGIVTITFGILFLEYGRPVEGVLFVVWRHSWPTPVLIF